MFVNLIFSLLYIASKRVFRVAGSSLGVLFLLEISSSIPLYNGYSCVEYLSNSLKGHNFKFIYIYDELLQFVQSRVKI